MDRRPNPCQSSAEGNHFGFQASVLLTTINKNMPPALSIRIDPSILSPTHSSRSHNKIQPQNAHALPPEPSQDENAEFEVFNADGDMSTYDFINASYLCY